MYEKNDEILLPVLNEFSLENVPFQVVDPSGLPERTLAMFDNFMAGSAVPHQKYVYAHDYERFCMLVREGRLPLS